MTIPITASALVDQRALRLLCEQQRRAQQEKGECGGRRHARRSISVDDLRHLRERELVQVDVPAGGVLEQHQRADGSQQRGGDDGRHALLDGRQPQGEARQDECQRREPHHPRPGRHDVGELFHVEGPAGQDEQADGQRDESDELREIAARFSALGDGHDLSNYSDDCSAAISLWPRNAARYFPKLSGEATLTTMRRRRRQAPSPPTPGRARAPSRRCRRAAAPRRSSLCRAGDWCAGFRCATR